MSSSDQHRTRNHIEDVIRRAHRDAYMAWWDEAETLGNKRSALSMQEAIVADLRLRIEAVDALAAQHEVTVPDSYDGHGNPIKKKDA